MPKLLTINQVAALLGFSRVVVYKLLRDDPRFPAAALRSAARAAFQAGGHRGVVEGKAGRHCCLASSLIPVAPLCTVAEMSWHRVGPRQLDLPAGRSARVRAAARPPGCASVPDGQPREAARSPVRILSHLANKGLAVPGNRIRNCRVFHRCACPRL